jgi:hypothetical protein
MESRIRASKGNECCWKLGKWNHCKKAEWQWVWCRPVCRDARGALFARTSSLPLNDAWQTLFQEKDYLDGRFFHKKSYYLAVLAQSISTTFDVDTFYSSALGDPRLTTLVLRPRNGIILCFDNKKLTDFLAREHIS